MFDVSYTQVVDTELSSFIQITKKDVKVVYIFFKNFLLFNTSTLFKNISS